MNSASSTEPGAGKDAGIQPWHFFLLLAMVGATWSVIEARHTHPAALILLSIAILAAGAVAIASHAALRGFFVSGSQRVVPLSATTRDAIEEEKALVLRSIKELEFDRAMGKVGDADFADIGARLRARALDLMDQLDRPAAQPKRSLKVAARAAAGICGQCQAANDADARFCKQCGAKL